MSVPETSPLVCICVPTYNVAPTVRETVDSILAQSYPNIVVHVCDNASTDGTLRVLADISDPRLSIHAHTENVGAEGNFTRCIQLAHGSYTAIFHADDLYEPDMIASQVAYLETHPEVGAVFTEAVTIDEHGVPFGRIGGPPIKTEGVARFDFQQLLQTMLLHHNFLVCPSVLVRTEIYRDEIKVWGSSAFKSASDVDTWLQLASKRPIAILDKALMRYRISSAQFSHRNRNRTERADFFLVMDHYLQLPQVRSFLTTDDLQHYRWLERHENVARAMNLFGAGRTAEARELLDGLFCRDAVRAALATRRGLVTLAGGTLLRMVLPFGTLNASRSFIRFVKQLSWRGR